MQVLALCSYPLEAASTRYRLSQYIEPLSKKGIDLTVNPFLDKDAFSSLYAPAQTFKTVRQLFPLIKKRFLDSFRVRKFDAVLIQREAMIFGPPIFEWLTKTVGRCPIILDLDDATYIRYISPTHGKLAMALKFFGKTDTLIDWAETVICGNRHIAEYVQQRGKKTVIVPTVVDTDKFHPVERDQTLVPIIGWIGTHSTFPFLESIFPVLTDLAKKFKFIVRIIGSGKKRIDIDGVRVENLEWVLEREISDFQSLDIGLYPMQTTDLVSDEWLKGKSGLKAIQYMSVGIPFVVTPVGITTEIGDENETHFSAASAGQWHEKLEKLLASDKLRKKMGANGRAYVLKNYTVAKQAETLALALRNAVEDFSAN